MNKQKLKRGQKVVCTATQHIKYQYGIEAITNDKEYEIIRGFGEECSSLGITLDVNEFNIVDNDGNVQWFTLTGLEDEPIFKLVESK